MCTAFSYKEEESEVVNKAKEIAKRNNQSFSKLVMEALAKYIDEQKNLIALDNSAISLAVRATNNASVSYLYNSKKEGIQKTIDFFCLQRADLPKLVNRARDRQELGWMEGHCKEFIKLSKVRMNRF